MFKVNNFEAYQDISSRPPFSLEKYGYILDKPLNNENRWHAKIVCSILDKEGKHYVSTIYAKQNDYSRLIENITFLKCNDKLSPEIVNVYPRENAVICKYVGEFLPDYLLIHSFDITPAFNSILEYFKDINSLDYNYSGFVIPPIIKTSIQLTDQFDEGFEFLPRCKHFLPELERSGVEFDFGCGIEDPHIWNFRIVKSLDKTQALTTDFDYFSGKINYFWELGYLFATLRWLNKNSFSFVSEAEKFLFSLAREKDLKANFMFWLGVLSSYCGYQDSLKNLFVNGSVSELGGQHSLIQQLDEKVSCLATRLCAEPRTSNSKLAALQKDQGG